MISEAVFILGAYMVQVAIYTASVGAVLMVIGVLAEVAGRLL